MFQNHPVQHEALMLITTNTRNRIPYFKNSAHAREAIEHLYRIQSFHPFFLFGFVIMPDHCHLLLKVPFPGSISKIMRIWKSGLTFQIGKGAMWQSRFHIKIIEKGASAVLDYIHENPVRAKICAKAEGYLWSSANTRWKIHPLDIE